METVRVCSQLNRGIPVVPVPQDAVQTLTSQVVDSASKQYLCSLLCTMNPHLFGSEEHNY
jgi:hypothetical protein